MTEMHNTINKYLDQLEVERNIKILLAVEAGSRAWGFESENSDWDVRFIYTRNQDWYDSLYSDTNQSIDANGPDDVDGHGWILPKALRLLHKGNAAIHEWIHSPIVYKRNISFYARMGRLSKEYFNPLPAMWHYVELASGNYHRYIENNDEYKLKRLLYVWRAMMVSKYIFTYGTFPGTPIDKLINESANMGIPVQIRTVVNKLITMKKSGLEMGVGKWNEYNELLDFLVTEINDTKVKLKNGEVLSTKNSVELLNQTYRRFK